MTATFSMEDVYRENRYLRNVVRKYARDAHDLNDILQEGYLKAMLGLPGFRGESSLKTWLHSVFTNAAIEHVKKYHRGARQRISLGEDEQDEMDLDYHLGSVAHNPELELEAKQRMIEISRALSSLPHMIKAAVELRVFKELSYEEIANRLHVPIGTVRSRLHRAKHNHNIPLT